VISRPASSVRVFGAEAEGDAARELASGGAVPAAGGWAHALTDPSTSTRRPAMRRDGVRRRAM
jgi:hypothetical protein